MRLNRYRNLICPIVISIFLAIPARADVESAKRAFRQQDYAAALKELTPLAEKGDAEAQDLLGLMYATGRGVPISPSHALKWYKASAEQGDRGGEFHLGSIYLMGAGIPRNVPEGLRLLTLSAEQGMPDAQFLLGMAYANLKGVPSDPVLADKWLRVAEARGDTFAAGQRAKLEERMTRDQIAQAQALAEDFKPTSPPRESATQAASAARQ